VPEGFVNDFQFWITLFSVENLACCESK
jgi:hypothetical protein